MDEKKGMRNRFFVRYNINMIRKYSSSAWLPFLSALLLSLALPWVGFSFLIWVAFVPLLLFLADERISRTKAFTASALALLLFMFALAYPMMHIEGAWWAGTHDLNRYLNQNIQFTIGIALFALLRAVFFMPFIPLVRATLRRSYGIVLVAAAWAAIEWAFASFASWGYTPGVIGYSLVDSHYEKHAAFLGGVYFLSFIVVAVNGIIAILLRELPLHKRYLLNRNPSIIPLFMLFTALLCYGFFAERTSPTPGVSLRVAVIASSLSTEASVSEEAYRVYRKKLIQALTHEPDLVMFPENVFPYFELKEEDGSLIENTLVNFPNRDALYADLIALSRAHASTTLAIGIHTTRAKKHYNSMVLMQGGVPTAYYTKRVLVPFTEFSPLGLRLPLAVHFTPGASDQYFTIHGVRSSALICSEIADSNIPMKGIGLILAPSNDSIFEGRAASAMHENMAQMRAIEQHAYVLRSNKVGRSTIIDPNGKIIASSDDDVIVATLRIEAAR